MRYRDGDWELFEYDFQTKRQVWLRRNADGTDTYRTDYHVDEVLAANHDARMESHGQRFGDWRRIASVPIAKHFSDLAEAQMQRDDGYIDKWLNENSAFKTFR